MRSFQSKLIVSYSLLLFLLFCLIFGIFCLNLNAGIQQQQRQDILARAETTRTNLDSRIQTISDASIRCLYSNRFKELFFDALQEESNAETVMAKREMADIVYSTSGPVLPFRQAYFLNSDGRLFCAGYYTGYRRLWNRPTEAYDWYQHVLNLNGKMSLVGKHEDEFGHIHEPVFSLYRAFGRAFGKEVLAVLEIQERFSVLENMVSEQCPGDDVLIIDGSGSVFYSSDQPSFDLEDAMQPLAKKAAQQSFCDVVSFDGREYLVGHAYSYYTNMHIWVFNSTRNVFLLGSLNILR